MRHHTWSSDIRCGALVYAVLVHGRIENLVDRAKFAHQHYQVLEHVTKDRLRGYNGIP